MSRDLTLSAGPWQVAFRRSGDRFGHEIAWRMDDGRHVALLASLEGAPDDCWPPSPPLQELHIERQTGAREVALLVGMAGANHWSVSVEASGDEQTLTVDAACRLHGPPAALGSTYRLAAGVAAEVGAPANSMARFVVLRAGGLVFRVSAERLADGPAAEILLEERARLVCLRPACGAIEALQTCRWRYRFAADR